MWLQNREHCFYGLIERLCGPFGFCSAAKQPSWTAGLEDQNIREEEIENSKIFKL